MANDDRVIDWNFNPERAEKKAETTAADHVTEADKMADAPRLARVFEPLDLDPKAENLPSIAAPVIEAETVEAVEVFDTEPRRPVAELFVLERPNREIFVRVFVAVGAFGAVLFVATVAFDIAAAVRPVIAHGAADIAATACRAVAGLVEIAVWVLGIAAVGLVAVGTVGSVASASSTTPKNALADIEARRRPTRAGNETGRPIEINVGKIEIKTAE